MAVSWSTPPSFTAGSIVRALNLQQMSDNQLLIGKRPIIRMYQQTAQTIPTATYRPIYFNTAGDELVDRGDTDGTSAHSYTADSGARVYPQTPGWYWVQGQVVYAADISGNQRQARIHKGTVATGVADNSAIVAGAFGRVYPSTVAMYVGTPSVLVQINTVNTDYVQLVAYHDTGANLSTVATGSSLTLIWMSPN